MRECFKEIGKGDNIDFLEMLQGEKVLIPRNNKVGLDLYGTFDDTVIRLISQEMKMRQSLYDCCDFGDGL